MKCRLSGVSSELEVQTAPQKKPPLGLMPSLGGSPRGRYRRFSNTGLWRDPVSAGTIHHVVAECPACTALKAQYIDSITAFLELSGRRHDSACTDVRNERRDSESTRSERDSLKALVGTPAR